MKHLFLEGPIQTGKSTLIRQVLKPYLDSMPEAIGGFASQRLTVPLPADLVEVGNGTGDPQGEITMAFRIGPAATTPLTAPLEDYLSNNRDVTANSGIFKFFGVSIGGFPGKGSPNSGRPKASIDTGVFESEGIRYLQDTEGRRIMLLDEIGGHELRNEEFMAALCELLAGDIPCIGVIKHPDSTKRMDPALLELNQKLHRKIREEFSGEILYYERGSQSDIQVQETLTGFIENIDWTK